MDTRVAEPAAPMAGSSSRMWSNGQAVRASWEVEAAVVPYRAPSPTSPLQETTCARATGEDSSP